MPEPRIVILGAGPAGLGAAYRLRVAGLASVTVLEQKASVGGNAGSFEVAGQRVDFGSHRLHPACEPQIMEDIHRFLGDDLLTRPRHGRIRLRGRWVHFPLRPLDLLFRLDRPFALGALRDAFGRITGRGRDGEDDSFASVLLARLGPTICEQFYFPYARKIWGLEPEALSATQAHRRVAANSVGKLVRKVLGGLPGVRSVGFSHFYYPRQGFGRICEAYAEEARRAGAELLLGRRVTAVERDEGRDVWRIVAEGEEGRRELEADAVWSTIPITALAGIIRPAPPSEVREAAMRMDYRAMLLVYLTLPRDRFTEYDAHYFPGPEISITRLSETKNYAALQEPRDRTTLCAELPCAPDDEMWSLGDEALGAVVLRDLETAGIRPAEPPIGVTVRRLRHAYPIYGHGYEGAFARLDEWAGGLPGVLTFGRQGLFAHDNTHHALFMAYSAVECLREGRVDPALWAARRTIFETHVVED